MFEMIKFTLLCITLYAALMATFLFICSAKFRDRAWLLITGNEVDNSEADNKLEAEDKKRLKDVKDQAGKIAEATCVICLDEHAFANCGKVAPLCGHVLCTDCMLQTKR